MAATLTRRRFTGSIGALLGASLAAAPLDATRAA